jgi:hypothetical protein
LDRFIALLRVVVQEAMTKTYLPVGGVHSAQLEERNFEKTYPNFSAAVLHCTPFSECHEPAKKLGEENKSEHTCAKLVGSQATTLRSSSYLLDYFRRAHAHH